MARPAHPATPPETTKPIVRYFQTETPRLSVSVSFSWMAVNSARKRWVTQSVQSDAISPTRTVTTTSSFGDPMSQPSSVAGGTAVMPLAPPVRVGVSKMMSCNISLIRNVMNMK